MFIVRELTVKWVEQRISQLVHWADFMWIESRWLHIQVSSHLFYLDSTWQCVYLVVLKHWLSFKTCFEVNRHAEFLLSIVRLAYIVCHGHIITWNKYVSHHGNHHLGNHYLGNMFYLLIVDTQGECRGSIVRPWTIFCTYMYYETDVHVALVKDLTHTEADNSALSEH